MIKPGYIELILLFAIGIGFGGCSEDNPGRRKSSHQPDIDNSPGANIRQYEYMLPSRTRNGHAYVDRFKGRQGLKEISRRYHTRIQPSLVDLDQ